MADYRSGIADLALRSLAPSTSRAYAAAWRDWSAFRVSDGNVSKSVDECLLAFVWGHYQAGRSKSAMSAALAGISFYSRMEGVCDPTKSFLLAKVLRGWARVRPAPVDSRRPIDLPLLGKLVAVLANVAETGFEATLFGLAFSCAFFGAFRVGELVADSRRSMDTGLLFSNMVFREEAVLCRLPRSKTDQAGRGRWVTLRAQPEGAVCPVRLAASYSLIRPAGSPQWLLHMDGSPLTRFQFGAVFQRCLQRLGCNCKEYGTHSFRIGAATSAAARGLSAADIQELGRWKSGAFKAYVRLDKV